MEKKLEEMLRRGLEDTEGFWGEVAEELHWFKRWDKVFEWTYPTFTWFKGGLTNISYNCLEYQIEKGRGNHAAIIFESGEGLPTRVLTYNQLLYEVKRFASALKALGVKKGDVVAIYLPTIPEAAIAALATARIGAIHSIVFAGFGYGSLAERIIDAESRIVITADVGYRRGAKVKLKEIVDEALKMCGDLVQTVIVLKRDEPTPPMVPGRDIYWEEALAKGVGITAEVEPMRADEFVFILYTSGTTAKPKGTVQTHGGYQVHIYAMGKWVYDMKETDVWWSTSDVGWIVGHSYVIYAPLLFGCSTVMYEGVPDYPTPDVWWRIVEKNRVTQMWISPTGVRGVMKYGAEVPKKYDLSSVRLIVCAGEVLNAPAWEWLSKDVFEGRVPVIDHMWQTESGGPIVGNPAGIALLPIKPGSATIPLPGIEGAVVDEDGKEVPVNEQGIFVVKRPFPGLTPTLWKDPERYRREYWDRIPGVYYSGDAAIKDEDGYIWFLGRADEVIKVAAHRIGTIEVESALLTHPSVAEAAVFGSPDPVKGEVPIAFIVLKNGYQPSPELTQTLNETVRKVIGPIATLKDVFFVSKIPKTRSGKLMRRLMKAIITDRPLGDYSTIEDEAAIDEVRRVLGKA